MIYELRVYRVVQGRMAALHDTLRTSNLADNGPPWHPASRVLDDNSARLYQSNPLIRRRGERGNSGSPQKSK